MSRALWMAGVLAALIAMAGCSEEVISSGATVTQGSGAGTFNPNNVPRLLAVTPNVGPDTGGTEFEIEGVNLLPLADVVVEFGANVFNGQVNNQGNKIINPSAGNLKFTAPAGTGAVDLLVSVSNQNPPTLSLPNAFIYLPPGAPALPTVLTMTPNTSDEFGGTVCTFTGTNVPTTYTVVVSFLFPTGTVNAAALNPTADTWTCTIPAVPATENFTTGALQVTVTCTISDPSMGLPVPVVVAAPPSLLDGNPFTYTNSGTPPAPLPQEYVIASGLSAPNSQNTPDSFVRTVEIYDPVYDRKTGVTGLQSRYMFNGAMALAPNGTHEYPSPLSVSNASWRDASSTFSHFALPQFSRTYTPAVPDGQPAATPVTGPVTATLYHCTNTETGAQITGNDDSFFAVYSNGDIEVFNTGGGNIHEEIQIHENFANFPYFAVAHDSAQARIYVARLDGTAFTASGSNTNEINCTSVTGQIKPLSLKLAGNNLYFVTTAGEVYRSPIDSGTSGVNPVATACNWPGGAVHTYVADELNLSGDGSTIAFVAGTGIQRFVTAGGTPPDTHNIFAIRNANTGNTNIIAVTDFAAAGGGKQIQMWNIDDSATSTYGSLNVDNGANDRRVYMAGVNAFSTATNRPGNDVAVNFDGELCAFVTREDRNVVDSVTPAFVVYYLYVARIGQGTNDCARLNSATTGSFGIGAAYDGDMTVVPGFFFPKKAPNNGMRYRLVFTIAGVSGGGVVGENQHVYTADIPLTGTGIGSPTILDRSESGQAPPFNVSAANPSWNYYGSFQSRRGDVLFLIDATTGGLFYLDLRDGVSSLAEPVRRAHDSAAITLPRISAAGALNENTYVTSGFAEDPAGAVGLEHWGNQLRSLQGPGLSTFTQEYLIFVGEENPGEEEVYMLQMLSLANPLPSEAINVTNTGTTGLIKGIFPSKDGGVMAVVKGSSGFPQAYRYSGTVDGSLFIINDVVGMLNDNASSLTSSAEEQTLITGGRFSRKMAWYRDATRYSLYFGEGSSTGNTTGSPPPRSFLRFTRIDIDRQNGNMIMPFTTITHIGGTALTQGAVYIYDVGKRE
mgnify:CR=1 FL=1